MTVLRHSFAIAAACLIIASSVPASVAGEHDAERAFIESLGNKVVLALQSEELSPETKHEQLSAVFLDAVDLDVVGRYVLGRHWRAADDAQRAEYQRLFRTYAVNLYANSFSDYSGQTFMVSKAQAAPKDTVIVSTQILRQDGPPAGIDFRVRNQSGALKIIDVMVEGVSLVATKRSEFAAIIGHSGIEGLLAGLRSHSPETSG